LWRGAAQCRAGDGTLQVPAVCVRGTLLAAVRLSLPSLWILYAANFIFAKSRLRCLFDDPEWNRLTKGKFIALLERAAPSGVG
jgi:hypothetical protein